MYKYQEIADSLRREIENGRYTSGSRLPDQRTLAKRYGTSFLTLNKAVSVLVQSGLLLQRQGSGTYVRMGSQQPLDPSARKRVALLHVASENELATHSYYSSLNNELNRLANLDGYRYESVAAHEVRKTDTGTLRVIPSLLKNPNPMVRCTLEEGGLGGLIFLSSFCSHLAGELEAMKMAYVCIGAGNEPPMRNVLGHNAYDFGQKAMEYLVKEKNCRKIAVFPKARGPLHDGLQDFVLTDENRASFEVFTDFPENIGAFDACLVTDDYFALAHILQLNTFPDLGRMVVIANSESMLPFPAVKLIVDTRAMAKLAWEILKQQMAGAPPRKEKVLLQGRFEFP